MKLDEFRLEDRKGLPDALRVLLEDHPREGWASDPGFSDLVRFWLERHMMFRRLLGLMGDEVEDTLNGTMEDQVFAAHLRRYGGFFVQELHGHHMVEDHQYFPRLRGLDDRLTWGFDLLDRDHHAIDGLLNAFVEDTNAVLTTVAEGQDARKSFDTFRTRLASASGLLERHLTDEEELIVPVLLKYAPSGVV